MVSHSPNVDINSSEACDIKGKQASIWVYKRPFELSFPLMTSDEWREQTSEAMRA